MKIALAVLFVPPMSRLAQASALLAMPEDRLVQKIRAPKACIAARETPVRTKNSMVVLVPMTSTVYLATASKTRRIPQATAQTKKESV